MDRIRVLQVVPKLVSAGGQRVAMDLAKYLDPQQFHVEIVSLFPYLARPFEIYLQENGICVSYLTKREGFDIGIYEEFNCFIRKYKPQVIHNHLHGLHIVLPSLCINKVPVCIHTIHSVANQEATRLHRFIQRIAFHKFGVVPVSISNTVKETVRDVYGQIESPVIYNGVDPEKFVVPEFQRNTWRNMFGIPEDAFVFVNVASFGLPKNHRLLVFAFKNLVQTLPNSFLILVGDGQLHQEILQLVNEMGISTNVIFTGIRIDIAQILNASDCFVLSSDWEGLPIGVLEAMAASKPVIATNVGGIPELITPSVSGILVPSRNCEMLEAAMIELGRNPLKAKQMGRNGRQSIEERFGVHQMVKYYGELYLVKLKSAYGEKAVRSSA